MPSSPYPVRPRHTGRVGRWNADRRRDNGVLSTTDCYRQRMVAAGKRRGVQGYRICGDSRTVRGSIDAEMGTDGLPVVLAETLTMPETVAPACGELIATAGRKLQISHEIPIRVHGSDFRSVVQKDDSAK